MWNEKTQTSEKMISFKITTAQITLETERALRIATEAIWVQMRQRIFFDGLKSNGSPIGIYSPSYLIYRQQPPFNRTADPKIILVLTDSLRLNFVFDAIDAKTYKELKGLDDKVFLFYEEQILGWKFIQVGYKMVIDTDIS